ncbi:hypothetical protein FRC02_004143 [Tulasnella sp. 418]|nr:hypothetical protein FRC02_004143 [Tulasnella sp. 418]
MSAQPTPPTCNCPIPSNCQHSLPASWDRYHKLVAQAQALAAPASQNQHRYLHPPVNITPLAPLPLPMPPLPSPLSTNAVASSATSSNNRQDAESNTKGRTLANGKALRNTMKDKEAQIAMAKAKDAEKAKDEEAKKSKDAMSKLQTMKLPIDAPGRSPSTFKLPPRTPTTASEGSQQHVFSLGMYNAYYCLLDLLD